MLNQTSKRFLRKPKFWHILVLSVTLIAMCQFFGTQTFTNTNQISAENNLPSPSGTTNPNSFISTWNTGITGWPSTDNNTEITLPLVSSGTYNFVVQWGDGSNSTITAYNQPAKTHNYPSSGNYNVNITGQLNGWEFFYNSGDRQKLIGISQWGNITLGNTGNYFSGCSNLVLTANDTLNLTGTTNLESSFYGCSQLGGSGDMNGWDVSNVTNMNSMFEGATSFNQTIGNWNVSSVTNTYGMYNMFEGDSAFNQPIGNWSVSSVIDMDGMFEGATSFNQTISSWDVSSVTNMADMFQGDPVFNQNISSWDVSNVTNMADMFQGDPVFNQNISSWDVSSVTSTAGMFEEDSAFNQSLSNWDVSNDQYTDYMFCDDSAFNQPIGNWNVSSDTDTDCMFEDDSAFNQPIGNWNVSSVTDTDSMFCDDSAFNQPIGNWNVSSVTNMADMFQGDPVFNQNISSWDVSNDQYTDYMFCDDYTFNQPIGNWNVSSDTDTDCMFQDDYAFNQSLSNWNVSSDQDTYSMFQDDSAFNQPIGNWNVSSDTDTDYMFYNDSAFNQNISAWNVSNDQFMYNMFQDDSAFNQNISAWNVSNVQDMTDMFTNDTSFSTENYGALLIGWSHLMLYPSVTFSAGSTPYPVKAAADRQYIKSNFGWTINDGGPANISTPTLYPISSPSTTGNITLDWSSSLTASSYSIYRSNSTITTLTGATLIASNITTNAYEDMNLALGTYYYVIVATNGTENSSISNCESVSVIFIPSEPTNLVATAETNSILLNWTASTNNGGSTNLYYDVYRADSSNGPFTLIGNSTTTSYSDSNIPGGLYYYKITAANEAGQSNSSNVVSVTIILTPSTPTNLNATAETNSILLTWTSSTNNGGSTNLYYNVYRADSANGSFTLIGNSTTTSYNDTNVTAGQTYYYEISAVNSAGASGYSNVANATVSSSSANNTNNTNNNKKINGMGIAEILSVSVIGVLVVAITMKKRKSP